MSGTPGHPARPGDERLREQGLQVIMRFLAMVRVGRSYKVENQVFRRQLVAFIESLVPVFADVPEAMLISLDNDLYLNGVRLPVKATNLRFQQALMQEFARRRVAGVRVAEGVSPGELERFFRLFLQPDVYCGTALLEACLAEKTDHILPAVNASTTEGSAVNPFDPSSYEEGGESDPADGFGLPQAGGGEGGDTPAVQGPAGVRPAAGKSYSLAMVGACSLLTTTALQQGMEMRRVKRVVQPLIDGAFADEPVVVGLTSLSHHDEYTYVHAVNVCIIAVTMGQDLGLDRRALADLGVAALLHDVGKAAVYDRIHNPLESFDEEERRLAESHCLEGAKLLARSTTLNAATLRCMHVALEHHARGNGPPPGGDASRPFPELPAGWRPSLFSGIVSVADCYVSLLMHRSERGRHVTPYRALGMMLGPYAERFDPMLLRSLVHAVGFYPPGQLVELSNGQTAVVLAPNRSDPARPNVRIIMDECGVPFSAIEAKELRPIPPTLSVARALTPGEYPNVPMSG